MAKEGSSDYKKVRKRWLFKESLTEWFFVEPKNGSSIASPEEPFESPLFFKRCGLLQIAKHMAEVERVKKYCTQVKVPLHY